MRIDAVIIGSLNTDIILTGFESFPKPGEAVIAGGLEITAGGKSRNIANMLATLKGQGAGIAFIGKTVADKYGFWRLPYDSLVSAGIDVSAVQILPASETVPLPGIAVIPIDATGQNNIYLHQGIKSSFVPADLHTDSCNHVFQAAQDNSGVVGLCSEMSVGTLAETLAIARTLNLKTFIDAGGADFDSELREALRAGGFLIKPNEHEAEGLTGIVIKDFISARRAADVLLEWGYEHVLITHGAKGAYAFGAGPVERLGETYAQHIPAPTNIDVSQGDSLGCGDQTLAAVMFACLQGKTMIEAARIGVISGSLQHTHKGIVPVTPSDLAEYNQT